MASKKAEGLLAPLLDSDDESSTGSCDSDADSDANSKMETVKKSPMQKLKTLLGKSSLEGRFRGKANWYCVTDTLHLFLLRIVYVGLGGGIAASAAAMVLAPVVAIFVMGGVCIAKWVIQYCVFVFLYDSAHFSYFQCSLLCLSAPPRHQCTLLCYQGEADGEDSVWGLLYIIHQLVLPPALKHFFFSLLMLSPCSDIQLCAPWTTSWGKTRTISGMRLMICRMK